MALITTKFNLALGREAVINFQNTQYFSPCVKIKSRTVSKPIHSKYFQASAVYMNIMNFSKLTMSGLYCRWRVHITHFVYSYRNSLKLIHTKAAKPENSRRICQIQQLYTILIDFHLSYICKTWLTSLKFPQPNLFYNREFYRSSFVTSSSPNHVWRGSTESPKRIHCPKKSTRNL